MNLLLVEDDLNLGRALLKLLSGDHAVEWVRLLASAASCFAVSDYDLVLLDLGLPDGDGRDWIRELRARGSLTPILILSAREEVRDRVEALDLGADDFLVKPFEPAELMARIRVLQRRRFGSAGPRIDAGMLSYEVNSRSFTLDGQELSLTPREHDILVVLIAVAGRPVSRERLSRELGGDVGSNALEVHIHSLRKALGRERISTVRGFGYRLEGR